MPHPIHRFSALARPVEPKYPTNLAVLLLMGAALIALTVTALVRGASVADAALSGVLGAIVVFATWALARELAPDDNPAAFVALVPVAAIVILGVTPLLLAPLLAVALTRIVNRTVGPPATVVDRAAVIALVLVIAREGHGWAIGAAAVLAFGLDAMLPDRYTRGWLFAALAAAATVVGVLTGAPTFAMITPGPWTIGALVTAGLFALVVATQPPPSSSCDLRPRAPLRRDRVQGGMVVALVAVAGSLMGGDAAVQSWAVIWAALAGVVVGRPLHLRTREPRA